MSKTGIATGNTLAKKLFEEKLFRDARKESYFVQRFFSSSGDNLVYEKSDLVKGKGESIVFGLRMRLSGAGVTEGDTLEGNEEALSFHNYTLTLSQYRHAVRDDGAMTRQRTAFDIAKEHEMAIKDWQTEKIDSLCFAAILNSPTKVFYRNSSGVSTAASAATAKAGLDATNSKLTLNFISFVKTWAQTGGARTYIPLRPVKVEGDEMFVLLTHNDALYDLRVDSTFQQAMREAMNRGKDNPLFRSAVAVWDNVVIHAHENCTVATDGGGASVPWVKSVFMGQQSLCAGWGQRPEIVKETFDYKNEEGVGVNMIFKADKPVFNSLDFGSLGVYLARTNVSGT